MKNMTICCDGTWNTPDQQVGGAPAPTNVVRLYNAVSAAGGNGEMQRKYYHPGVGTDGSWWDKMLGGGVGAGLDRNIMSAYRELCDHYETGDQIFLFGFSRGAYTVRSLAGLVSGCGLLDTRATPEEQIWQRIERVLQCGYRYKSERRDAWQALGWAFHPAPDGAGAIPIRFVGVWDTVGALGIPDDMAVLNLLDNRHDYTFHDTELSASVQTARHALALDELRASFQPTLWSSNLDGRDVRQLWFPGVHSDIGGGYHETGLSDGPLAWMIEEAAACGLAFQDAMRQQIAPAFHGILHESGRGAFALMPTQPRSIPQIGARSELHRSALDRQSNPPIHQCPYRQPRSVPPAAALELDVFAAQKWNETGLWLEAGCAYAFTARGEWIDSSIKCGPAGASDGNFQPAELAHVAGTALGKVEDWFKALANNDAAAFRFTKRHEDMPWFCLVGAVANGGGVDAKGHTLPHESFMIGADRVYIPKKSGYFFAYANDAWNCYGNNRGHVQLSVAKQAA